MSDKPNKISISVLRTVNLGNYENVKIEAGIEESLAIDESYEEAYSRIWQEVKAAFLKALADEEIKKESVEAPTPPDPAGSRYRRIKTIPES